MLEKAWQENKRLRQENATITAERDEARRDLALAHSAYVVAEQTSLELFAQRNAARDAIARHADGEGR